MNGNPLNQTGEYDHGVTMRLAGIVIAALIGVFALQKLGFRFVMSAQVAP